MIVLTRPTSPWRAAGCPPAPLCPPPAGLAAPPARAQAAANRQRVGVWLVGVSQRPLNVQAGSSNRTFRRRQAALSRNLKQRAQIARQLKVNRQLLPRHAVLCSSPAAWCSLLHPALHIRVGSGVCPLHQTPGALGRRGCAGLPSHLHCRETRGSPVASQLGKPPFVSRRLPVLLTPLSAAKAAGARAPALARVRAAKRNLQCSGGRAAWPCWWGHLRPPCGPSIVLALPASQG